LTTPTDPVLPATRGRRARQWAFRAWALVALFIVVAPAVWLVAGVVARAVPHWRWSVLTTTTAGTGGGLENAVLGSLVLMAGVLVVAGSVGVMSGIHLAGMAPGSRPHGRVTAVARLAIDVLSGFPSIVLGYVGYVALVVGLHWQYSLLPAVLVLSVMVVPYIARSTETALRQVPAGYREGADALGMPGGYALRRILLRAALPGITTGLLVALAIAGGETAPLIYTAGWSTGLPSAALVHHQIGYLTYPIWEFWNYPLASARTLSYDAALVLMVLVLLLLVAARFVVARTQRHAEGRRT